jgi:glycosylphosphatidylinositol transamidase (GPIT) subunit GPI8
MRLPLVKRKLNYAIAMYVDCKANALTDHTAVFVNVILVESKATESVYVSHQAS